MAGTNGDPSNTGLTYHKHNEYYQSRFNNITMLETPKI